MGQFLNGTFRPIIMTKTPTLAFHQVEFSAMNNHFFYISSTGFRTVWNNMTEETREDITF